MKYVIYILTAILATIASVFFILMLISEISDGYFSLLNSFLFVLTISLALGIFSLIQLFKSTPRLILLFSGAAFFNSIYLILSNELTGYYLFAAGLLPAIYEFIHYDRLVRNVPVSQAKKGGLLIAAGVVACAYTVLCVMTMVRTAAFYTDYNLAIPITYYAGIRNIIRIICLAVFSFNLNRRTNIFYRLFLIGPTIFGVLFFRPDVSTIYIAELGNTILNLASWVLSLALVLIVLIHTFKTRHDTIIPQEPDRVIQQPFTSAV